MKTLTSVSFSSIYKNFLSFGSHESHVKSDFSQPIHNNKLIVNKKFKNNIFVILLGLFIFIILIFLIASKMTSEKTVPQTSQTQIPAPVSKAKESLNKQFTFSLKDSRGIEVTKFTYVIESAELTDQIIVKGQQATAITGKTFLILNLKLTNNYTSGVQVNTRDYIRLSVNGESELLAPDIHNDPVEVQAISTKYTRVGFPINVSDKKLILHIGEIQGEKEEVKLDFKK
jgi:hypothetical protein